MAQAVVAGNYQLENLNQDNIINSDGRLNLTYLALYHAEYINGVAQKHGGTSQKIILIV